MGQNQNAEEFKEQLKAEFLLKFEMVPDNGLEPLTY